MSSSTAEACCKMNRRGQHCDCDPCGICTVNVMIALKRRAKRRATQLVVASLSACVVTAVVLAVMSAVLDKWWLR